MRYIAPAGIGLFGIVATASPALAQTTALPPPTKCPAAVAEVATCYSAKHASGAYILAAMPKTWNGNLVVLRTAVRPSCRRPQPAARTTSANIQSP